MSTINKNKVYVTYVKKATFNAAIQTATFYTDVTSSAYQSRLSPANTIAKIAELESFNKRWDYLNAKPRKDLYSIFQIPKASGGWRTISAPNSELSQCLRELKFIFENNWQVHYHTNAYAYTKNRSTLDCVKKHQSNQSVYFAKYDLHDFFGSTTLDFLMEMLSIIYPFNEVIKNPKGEAELRKALDLAFLDGGLPQGTPLSPFLTNVFMVPVDYILTKKLMNYNGHSYCYTRYADDFCISSRSNFNAKEVEDLIIKTLTYYNAPFQLNTKKTKYGSNKGKNWILGVMLNGNNEITVGHKNKKQFNAGLTNYIMDKKNGKNWSREDVQILQGKMAYYKMVEPSYIDDLVNKYNTKFSIDIITSIKDDLR